MVPYQIRDVTIYPNYSVESKEEYKDTTKFKAFKFVQNDVFFKPKRLSPYILIKPEENYSPKNSKYTSRRLSNIGTYKFVNINYKENDTVTKNGKRHLDV